jgi:hypothetical protein
MPEGTISLCGLSTGQQRLVMRHLPLVHLTLKRTSGLLRRRRTGREYHELAQEGTVALIEAIRAHDPGRHGAFAPYAMARVHQAVSRFAHEQRAAVRVPFITQRRRRVREREEAADRHDPGAPPTVRSIRADHRPRHDPHGAGLSVRTGEGSLSDWVRQRYERAARLATGQMRRSPRSSAVSRRLIERCRVERWLIPDDESRTSFRELARQEGCSLGRVTRCDEQFRARMIEILRRDDVFVNLMSLARRRGGSWDEPLSPSEAAKVHRRRMSGRALSDRLADGESGAERPSAAE